MLLLLLLLSVAGTEWLPNEAANRSAYLRGRPNEEIVKDPSRRRFMNTWDVAVFRGGKQGLLHRTPDDALHGPSIFMRLDIKAFPRGMH